MVASNEIIKIMVKSAKSYEVTISLVKPSWNVQMVRKHNSTFTAGLRIKWQSKKGIQLRNSTPTTPQWSQCRCDRSTFGMGIGGCKMVAATMDRMKSMNIMWLVQRLINVSKTLRCGLKVAYLKCKSRTYQASRAWAKIAPVDVDDRHVQENSNWNLRFRQVSRGKTSSSTVAADVVLVPSCWVMLQSCCAVKIFRCHRNGLPRACRDKLCPRRQDGGLG
jgi:hypothetical protein